MTFLYWNIGRDITENVLNNQKAEYGKSVIKKLSKKLVSEYGRGYGERNIFRMLKFYDYFPDFEILSTLSTMSAKLKIPDVSGILQQCCKNWIKVNNFNWATAVAQLKNRSWILY